MSYALRNLDALEAEAIHVIREVAAEFENPVLLYSIGKDSMCMLHVARKAFAPGPVPFPLLHIDTTWNFREMIEFRDRWCAEHGFRLLPGEVPVVKRVRFRTMGDYPLTAAHESSAVTVPEIIEEMLLTRTSERQGRLIDKDEAGSMEKKKREGYF
jgi:3'-phosphoadenosine 5'-phosphosulfate sulfotransferase (PAPS reductase)/FAD synthetase